MYGMKMGGKSAKKTQTYKDANEAVKGARKRGEPSITFMVAVGKPKMLPKKGQRTATNMMKKSSRGK
jgi:hypothetical protein